MVSDLLNINQSPNWVLSLFGSIQKILRPMLGVGSPRSKMLWKLERKSDLF